MLHSMTGFGSAAGRVDSVEYAVEIRSVNNRYFKAAMKLPESFSLVEAEIEKLLRERLCRGTVMLTVRMKVPDDQAAYRVNTAMLSKYVQQLEALQTGPEVRIDLGSLLQLPGVCEPPPIEEILRDTLDGLMDLTRTALDRLMEMRRREGQAVEADLLGRCDEIQTRLSAIAERAPQVVQNYRDRLAARVNELTEAGKIKIDEESLAREVAVFAERCDIAEEVARLSGHVEQFRGVFAAPGPGGRKLDFIAQEMLREANTIGAKANDAQISHLSVDLKTAIDRIKEQAQNVE